MRHSLRTLFVAVAIVSASVVLTGIATASTSPRVAPEVFPTVTGGFGTTPTLAFPSSVAPTALESKILVNGDGAKVKSSDLLVANYVGQIWNGKVFDSSFSRSETAAFPIGIGAVIKGWDDTLVGKKVGDRVLLVIPPSLGYGSSGSSTAGISGTDTIVFVVDIVATYSTGIGAKESADMLTTATHGVTVKNLQSTAPKITVAKGTTKPTKDTAYVLARGTGAKTTKGMVILQFDAVNWSNKALTSTWTSKVPDGEYLGITGDNEPFEPLLGDRIGSWALLEIPANTNGGPYALAIHIVAEVPQSAAK